MSAPGIGCPEAESALLSCVLLLPTADAQQLVDSVQADDLTDPRLRDVLESARRLLAQDIRPDPVTVLGDLQRHGLAAAFTAQREAGVFLAALAAAAPSAGSWGPYRRVVVETAWRRRVLQAGERLLQAAGESALADLEQVLAEEVGALRAASLRWRTSYGKPPAVPLAAV